MRRDHGCADVRWIALATRPLTLSELSKAVEIKGVYGMEGKDIMTDLLQYCGCLVQIHPEGRVRFPRQEWNKQTHTLPKPDPQNPWKTVKLVFHDGKKRLPDSATTTDSDPDVKYIECVNYSPHWEKTVTLIHESARDFLSSQFPTNDASLNCFKIEKGRANLEIAQRCLDYFSAGSLQTKWMCFNTQQIIKQEPLLNYAATTG